MARPHLFVTQGDIRNLSCSAWLLPTNERLEVEDHWFRSPARDQEQEQGGDGTAYGRLRSAFENLKGDRQAWAGLGRTGRFAVPLKLSSQDPVPVLTALPAEGIRSAEELAPRLEDYLRCAAELVCAPREDDGGGRGAAVGTGSPGPHRSVPLLAVPFFGTAGGGGDIFRGAILDVMLRQIPSTLEDIQRQCGRLVDVALVLQDRAALALAQEKRRLDRAGSWPALEGRLWKHIDRLKDVALAGKLVPFMGAGVSAAAGAPTWRELLDRLADKLGVPPDIQAELQRLNALDCAEYLRSQCSDPAEFGRQVAQLVNVRRYGLAPLLLAGLPSPAAITLNFDTLFEDAAADTGNPCTVIPDGPGPDPGRWLLKLHGSVRKPETIVLTRGDHLEFTTSGEALSALVKAPMLTHHMLFVGFGLSDDHFHAIVHDVNRARPRRGSGQGPDPERMATVLTLHADQVRERLWQDRLKLVPMLEGRAPAEGDGQRSDDAGRLLEIFLDALSAHVIKSHAYFLAPHFEEALGEDQRELRRAVLDFADRTAGNPRFGRQEAWLKLEETLRGLGWEGNDGRPPGGPKG